LWPRRRRDLNYAQASAMRLAVLVAAYCAPGGLSFFYEIPERKKHNFLLVNVSIRAKNQKRWLRRRGYDAGSPLTEAARMATLEPASAGPLHAPRRHGVLRLGEAERSSHAPVGLHAVYWTRARVGNGPEERIPDANHEVQPDGAAGKVGRRLARAPRGNSTRKSHVVAAASIFQQLRTGGRTVDHSNRRSRR